MRKFDDMKLGIEILSHGKNTVVFDDTDMPSVMVVIPKMYSKDLYSGGADAVHPGFIVNGVTKEKVGFSKFINVVVNNRAYSLPLRKPAVNVTYDQAITCCRNKGNDFGVVPDSLWAAVSLWSRKNGTLPHGNDNYGYDYYYPNEKADILEYYNTGDGVMKPSYTATGSGPNTWSHDHTPAGIFDMKGNVFKWTTGYRWINGELNFIPNANSMINGCDMSRNSPLWKAILPDGTFVNPGTEGTIKMDYINNSFVFCTTQTNVENASKGCLINALKVADGVSIPSYLKDMAIYPVDNIADYKMSGFNGDNGLDEVVSLRGGYWIRAPFASPFLADLISTRFWAGAFVGFFSAFYGEL